MSAPAIKPQKIKRDLLGDGQELEALIVSAALQRPGIDTNAALARICHGAIQLSTTTDALEMIKIVGRNLEQRPILDEYIGTYGHDGDPWALDDYIVQLNSLFHKLKRQHQLTGFSVDEFKATRCTDVANGLRFAQQFTGSALHHDALGWIVWDGTRWARDAKAARELAKRIPDVIRAEVKQLAADMDLQDRETADRFQEFVEALQKWAKASASTRGVDNVLREAASCPGINGNSIEFDSNPKLLNFKNGTVCLQTGELFWPRPTDYITKIVPHNYVPAALRARLSTFLPEVFMGDTELIDYVHWALGYSVTGDVSQHVFFMMYGTGRNGKGALIRAIAHALGPDYFTTLNPEELLKQKHARNPTAIAALAGSRFVACQETDKGRNLNEAQVKTLTGGDRLKARFLFKDEFEFDPTFKIWMATNHRPVIDGEGAEGNLWERIRLIPFLRKFEASEKDVNLDDTLKGEAEGILAWLVEGACRASTGKEPAIPESVNKAMADYRKISDTLGEFLEEATLSTPQANCTKNDLHAAYCRWAKTQANFRDFNKRVAARGMKEKRITAGMGWEGLAIRPEFSADNWTM